MKRNLNDEEMTLAKKVLAQRMEDFEWAQYQVLYYKMMLKKGLEVNYKRTIREFKDKLREFDALFRTTEDTINILKDQIENGVEIKKDNVIKKVDNKEKQKGGKK